MLSTIAGVGSSILDAAQAGYNVFANERSRGDNLKQQDFQNRFAREQFNYQKDQNNLVMSREDTAIQRRVQDLKAAGLHPTLAVGGAAASSQAMGAGNAHPGGNIPPPNKLNNEMRIMQSAMFNQQMEQGRAQIDMTKAEAIKIKAEADAIPERLRLEALESGRRDHGADRDDKYFGIASAADKRAAETHVLSLTRRQLEINSSELDNIAKQLGISKSVIENKILDIELNHLKKTGYKLPNSVPTPLGPVVQLLRSLGATQSTIDSVSDWIDRSIITPVAKGYVELQRNIHNIERKRHSSDIKKRLDF